LLDGKTFRLHFFASKLMPLVQRFLHSHMESKKKSDAKKSTIFLDRCDSLIQAFTFLSPRNEDNFIGFATLLLPYVK
jgi:hypothetical protein